MSAQNKVRFVMAFAMILVLTLFVGTSILVGAFDMRPREAAFDALIAGVVLGAAGASVSATRKFFSSIWS